MNHSKETVEGAKARVLGRYPDARCIDWRGPHGLDNTAYFIYPDSRIFQAISQGWTTEKAAWIDAASRLKDTSEESIALNIPKGEGMSMFVGGPLLASTVDTRGEEVGKTLKENPNASVWPIPDGVMVAQLPKYDDKGNLTQPGEGFGRFPLPPQTVQGQGDAASTLPKAQEEPAKPTEEPLPLHIDRTSKEKFFIVFQDYAVGEIYEGPDAEVIAAQIETCCKTQIVESVAAPGDVREGVEPKLDVTDEGLLIAQNVVAKEYGTDWQGLVDKVCDNPSTATDVLIDLARTDATLDVAKRQLLAALQQVAENFEDAKAYAEAAKIQRERAERAEAELSRLRGETEKVLADGFRHGDYDNAERDGWNKALDWVRGELKEREK